MTTYTLTLTTTQAATISHACEVLARLGMGQYTDALECLPTKELCPDGWHEDMQAIGHILSKHANVHGLRYSQKHEARRTAMSNVAWDVYQVTRHRLAWDRARADGHTGDKPPTWGVSFDQPLQTSPEPLPQMTAAEQDQTPSKTGTKAEKMTTTPTEKPEAIWLADALDELDARIHTSRMCGEAAAELRCQHAEIARLTNENEALKAKNQPLLIHVIADMADGLTVWSDGKYVIDDYFAFARAIESAHGIGEKP